MIQCKVNGVERAFNGDPEMPLLWYLRDLLQLTGTKYGCGMGLCGACTVHVNYADHAVRACYAALAMQAAVKAIDAWPSCTYDTPRSVCRDAHRAEATPRARQPHTRRLGQRGATDAAMRDVQGAPMIFIAVKFSIRPEVADQWLARVAPFTAATRAEPGNLSFEWSRSTDRPNQFVLLEAFRDRAAGEAHVHSEHFKAAMAWMPDAVAATPDIIHVEAPGDGWSPMAELQPRTAP